MGQNEQGRAWICWQRLSRKQCLTPIRLLLPGQKN